MNSDPAFRILSRSINPRQRVIPDSPVPELKTAIVLQTGCHDLASARHEFGASWPIGALAPTVFALSYIRSRLGAGLADAWWIDPPSDVVDSTHKEQLSVAWNRMSSPSADDASEPNELLAKTLKAVRRHRRMTRAQIAKAMGIAVRTYDHWEAGYGSLNVERLQQFAAITNTDPFALMASLTIGSPEFAVRTADSKPLMIFMTALRTFNEAVGEDLTRLPARSFIHAFTRMLHELQDEARQRDTFAEDWLAENAPKPPKKDPPTDDTEED
ncbi:helix-turn-helix transcriptional regulator [Phenylobacterium sp.]|uniref:helix-turn-helix domain-containing protein n=1 Tax=Phenylobacterium sp. TaxID=1871053 RepID=UPI002E3251C0|nr:helix-turn-helix transcriptional regulator [Phenylobacterium sp.]HEX4712533.1 helix-turn-helix transcriptional regulator [Phenylobacterium sp.]